MGIRKGQGKKGIFSEEEERGQGLCRIVPSLQEGLLVAIRKDALRVGCGGSARVSGPLLTMGPRLQASQPPAPSLFLPGE